MEKEQDVVHPIDPDQLPLYAKDDTAAIRCFLAQLSCLSTFGLHTASQIATSLGKETRCWNDLNQSPLQQTPIVLITCTLSPEGNVWIHPKYASALRQILLEIPLNALILVVLIPWDPLQFVASVWMRVNAVASTEDSKAACDRQCNPWKINNIEAKWLEFLHTQLSPLEIPLVANRTVYLCLPSLILHHSWLGDEETIGSATAMDRRQHFVWNHLLHWIPQMKHCISWICLDSKQIFRNPAPSEGFIHTDIPWRDTQFINTLIFPTL